MPTLPLSLLPSFQVSFPLLASLQSVAVECRDDSSLPTRAQGQRVDLASWLLCTHIDSRWGGHIHSPDEIKVSSVAHVCSLVCPWGLPPRHRVSVHLPVQGFAPGPTAGLPHVILACLPPGGFRLQMSVHILCTTVKTLVSPP